MATETERIARIEGAYEHLATKADVETVKAEIQSVRSDLTAEIQSVRSEIQSVRSDLTAEIQSLRSDLTADIQEVRTEMDVMRNELRWLRWLMAIGVAGILLPLLQRLFAFLS